MSDWKWKMRSSEEQFDGLHKLAQLITAAGCNCAIYPVNSNGRNDRGVMDVAFLRAIDTPMASQIVYATDGYDVWSWDGQILEKINLSLKDAAEVVTTEYFLAKAARIKQHRR